MLAWLGLFGHLENLRSIAVSLINFISYHENVRFELMADPLLAEFFCFPATNFFILASPYLVILVGSINRIHLFPFLHDLDSAKHVPKRPIIYWYAVDFC